MANGSDLTSQVPPPSPVPLLFLVGTTASGKTQLSLDLAEALGAEILALDSMTVYRGLDIGTAKPGPKERERVPHHLIDLCEPTERFSVHAYLTAAEGVLADCARRSVRGLFVGGTALYLRALTQGLLSQSRFDPTLREELTKRAEQAGPAELHGELARVDPASAERIHPNDAKRIIRGLEHFAVTGTPLSMSQTQWHAGAAEDSGRPRRIIGLGPPRALLAVRIEARVRAMLAAGWVEEVRALADSGRLGPTAMAALGTPQILEHLAGRLSAEELVERISGRTRRFVRHQQTWLRRFPEIEWVPESIWELPESKRANAQLAFARECWSDLF